MCASIVAAEAVSQSAIAIVRTNSHLHVDATFSWIASEAIDDRIARAGRTPGTVGRAKERIDRTFCLKNRCAYHRGNRKANNSDQRPNIKARPVGGESAGGGGQSVCRQSENALPGTSRYFPYPHRTALIDASAMLEGVGIYWLEYRRHVQAPSHHHRRIARRRVNPDEPRPSEPLRDSPTYLAKDERR